jgi:hypothetical protein
VAVNGEDVESHIDPYMYAVNCIKLKPRPITLTFETLLNGSDASKLLANAKMSPPAATTTRATQPAEFTSFTVTFRQQKLGVALVSPTNPADLPTISHDPDAGTDAAGKVRKDDMLESVNGELLLGHPDTYGKAVELITTSGRPLVVGFRRTVTATTTLAQRLDSLFDALDVNKDGVLTRSELLAAAPRLNFTAEEAEKFFDALDSNGDGMLTRSEFTQVAAPEITVSLFVSAVFAASHHPCCVCSAKEDFAATTHHSLLIY